jgi:alkylhydroperoxidase family enzyme
VGLSNGDVARVREGASADGWTERQSLLLRAADELHARRDISAELWIPLRAELSDVELIELCMLIGHYEMLAMTINGLRIQPDPIHSRSASRLTRMLQTLAGRGRRPARGGAAQ